MQSYILFQDKPIEGNEILQSGNINFNKVENDARGKTYPLEGTTHDKQRVRIVFAPKPNGEMVVVTCIDLDTDWSCDCKQLRVNR